MLFVQFQGPAIIWCQCKLMPLFITGSHSVSKNVCEVTMSLELLSLHGVSSHQHPPGLEIFWKTCRSRGNAGLSPWCYATNCFVAGADAASGDIWDWCMLVQWREETSSRMGDGIQKRSGASPLVADGIPPVHVCQRSILKRLPRAHQSRRTRVSKFSLL